MKQAPGYFFTVPCIMESAEKYLIINKDDPVMHHWKGNHYSLSAGIF